MKEIIELKKRVKLKIICPTCGTKFKTDEYKSDDEFYYSEEEKSNKKVRAKDTCPECESTVYIKL